jgi:hypothetical protein
MVNEREFEPFGKKKEKKSDFSNPLNVLRWKEKAFGPVDPAKILENAVQDNLKRTNTGQRIEDIDRLVKDIDSGKFKFPVKKEAKKKPW